MSDNLTENNFRNLQRMLPLISSVVLLLMSYIPVNFVVSNNIKPLMSMICVYFWLLNRPDIFNLTSVYVLGIVEDTISSAPFGSNIFALLLLYVLVSYLAKYFHSKPFSITWYGFMLISLAVLLAKWLLVSIYYSQFLSFTMLLFSWMVTIAFYPIIGFINAAIDKYLLEDEEV